MPMKTRPNVVERQGRRDRLTAAIVHRLGEGHGISQERIDHLADTDQTHIATIARRLQQEVEG